VEKAVVLIRGDLCRTFLGFGFMVRDVGLGGVGK